MEKREKFLILSIVKAQFIYKGIAYLSRFLILILFIPFAFYLFIEAVKPQQLVYPNKDTSVIFGNDNKSVIVAPEFEKIISIVLKDEPESNYLIEYKGREAFIKPRLIKKIGDTLYLKAVDSSGNVYRMQAVFRNSSIIQKIELIDNRKRGFNERI